MVRGDAQDRRRVVSTTPYSGPVPTPRRLSDRSGAGAVRLASNNGGRVAGCTG